MTRIIIEGVAPDKMRLEAYREVGCGDWHVDQNGDIRIQVACEGDTDPWDHEDSFLVALHEWVEARLCLKAGIVQGVVDSFDAQFKGDGEPGSAADCPYGKEHRSASILEYTMAIFLGRWDYGFLE